VPENLTAASFLYNTKEILKTNNLNFPIAKFCLKIVFLSRQSD